MELVVDLDAVTVVLHTATDLARFSVGVSAPATARADNHDDCHRLGDVLRATNWGRLGEGGDAFISPDAIRFHAAGQVDDEWSADFQKTCDYAASKGWVDLSDGFIQGHIVWPG